MRQVYLIFIVAAMISTVCFAQQTKSSTGSRSTFASQGAEDNSQAHVSKTTGEKTVVGCIAIGAPSGYVVRGEDGSEFSLHTDRDLSSYVGKKVQIQVSWERKGLTLAESSEGGGGAATKAGAGANPAGQTDFAGDIHMQFTGKVLGDCHK